MAYPKIVYPSGGGTTLTFQVPPRFVPSWAKAAIRTDSISTAGVKQVILQRIEDFLEFTMEWIAAGSDRDAWKSFLDYALQGGNFDYYPDASQGGHTTYTLENQDLKIEYKSAGRDQIQGIRFRLYVSPT